MRKFGSYREGQSWGFLRNHIEKILFSLALCGSLALIIAGLRTRSGLDHNQSPVTLAEQTDSVERYIQQFDWDDFRDERETHRTVRPEPSPIQSAAYQLEQLIRPPYQQPRGRRMDPILLPAESLQVRTGFGVVKKTATQPRQDQVFTDQSERQPSNALGAYFNVVTAVVPLRKQLEEYQHNLALAVGYHQERDKPIYHNWMLERSEVGDDAVDRRWKIVGHRNTMIRSTARLERRNGPDFVDNHFIHPRMTMPIPLLDLPDRELEFLMRHDDIPRRTPENVRQVNIEEQNNNDDPSLFDPLPGAAQLQPPVDGGFNRWQAGQSQPGDGYPESNQSRQQIADQLMFRFIDFQVKPGGEYVYRLKLRLDDPNDPLRHPAPRAKDLDVTVQQRLLNRPEPPAEMVRAMNVDHIYFRDTDFSLPSRVVKTTTGNRVLLDSVDIPTSRRGYLRPGQEATSNLVLADFDRASASDLVTRVALIRGCVTNLERLAYLISRPEAAPRGVETPPVPQPDQDRSYPPIEGQGSNPVEQAATAELERQPHRYNSNVQILDMSVGRQLTEGLKSPAELLVFQDGQMRVIRSDECADEISRFPPPTDE